MNRKTGGRGSEREYLIAVSWCRRLKSEVAKRFQAARSGVYPIGDIVIEKKNNDMVFIWLRRGDKEVLVAWGAAWSTGKGYTWRCLDKALARVTVKMLAEAQH